MIESIEYFAEKGVYLHFSKIDEFIVLIAHYDGLVIYNESSYQIDMLLRDFKISFFRWSLTSRKYD